MPEIRNTIRLTNSMTRRKEVFEPLDPGNVRMYVCGPTVYDRAHLGNARPVVVFDVLYRLLRHVYGADHITYVRNITDVDDKIIDRARESGIPIDELTATTGAWFRDDMAALGALPPTHEPHATLHVDGMVAMISELVASGHAYVAGHHVLFSVASDPTYGRLSGRSTEDMIAGARVEIAPYKRDPMDFVLWKPSTEGQPGWPSPWGRGRPGWHIECSAMARQLLGPEFDIHGGGTDLLFPHHENEIAQSTSTGDRFARVWLHNEMLQVEGKKMSKSLGNFFTVRDLLDQGIPGEVIRLVFLMTHYRSPMDWTDRRAREAKVELANWYRLTFDSDVGECSELVIQALADDMNTHAAITECRSLYGRKDARTLKVSARLMGLLEDESAGWWRPPIVATMSAHEAGSDTFSGAAQVKVGPEGFVWELLRQRAEARSSRDFALADEIRDSLVAAGVVIMDRPDGPTEWRPGPDFDPAKLESLR